MTARPVQAQLHVLSRVPPSSRWTTSRTSSGWRAGRWWPSKTTISTRCRDRRLSAASFATTHACCASMRRRCCRQATWPHPPPLRQSSSSPRRWGNCPSTTGGAGMGALADSRLY
ncbi:MAG: hypothetical protein IPI73_13275 [Betaproteobacteria bacterium]|nr:hypothetical protein [Betaproteobacteria bacterium]